MEYQFVHLCGPVQTADLPSVVSAPWRFPYGSVSDIFFVLYIYTHLSVLPGLIARLNTLAVCIAILTCLPILKPRGSCVLVEWLYWSHMNLMTAEDVHKAVHVEHVLIQVGQCRQILKKNLFFCSVNLSIYLYFHKQGLMDTIGLDVTAYWRSL